MSKRFSDSITTYSYSIGSLDELGKGIVYRQQIKDEDSNDWQEILSISKIESTLALPKCIGFYQKTESVHEECTEEEIKFYEMIIEEECANKELLEIFGKEDKAHHNLIHISSINEYLTPEIIRMMIGDTFNRIAISNPSSIPNFYHKDIRGLQMLFGEFSGMSEIEEAKDLENKVKMKWPDFQKRIREKFTREQYERFYQKAIAQKKEAMKFGLTRLELICLVGFDICRF